MFIDARSPDLCLPWPASMLAMRIVAASCDPLYFFNGLPEGATVVLDDSVLQRNEALRELMGFARDIVEDGAISEAEAKGFRAWLEAHPDIRSLQSVDQILEILDNVLHDGSLDERELEELVDLLERFGG